MKKVISILLIGLLSISLFGCSSKSAAQKQADEVVETYQEGLKNTTSAQIVNSGTCQNQKVETDNYSIELVSWDLGYSGNPVGDGEEQLCLKFHLANKTSDTIEIQKFFSADVFVDGVSGQTYVSDFYGDNTAYNIDWSSELRGNSETDFYVCADCSVNDSHTIEIDIDDPDTHADEGQYTEVIDTFKFDIK